MSALSKFSTMKRPRWAGGTTGAVGGAAGGMGAGCAATFGGSGRMSVRGPTDSGGVVVSGGGAVATGGATGGGGIGGVAAVRGDFDAEAHPLSRARATTTAMQPPTLLLRGIGRWHLREATQEIRRQRTTARHDRRDVGLSRLRDDRRLSGLHRRRHGRRDRGRSGGR